MKAPLGTITRRTFGRVCAASFWFTSRFLRADENEPLTWVSQTDAKAGLERRYRADAQILLFAIPVLHRKGVGDGSAAWREGTAGDSTTVRMLEFSGRSLPEHAAGLNRLGFIQELSRGTDSREMEAIYFGLMTSSPEETAAEARTALHSNAHEASYSAIEGHIGPAGIETAGARFMAPVRSSTEARNDLIERARQALAGARKKKAELPPSDGVPQPFLHALAGLLKQPGSTEAMYSYNGFLYRLQVSRSADPKAARAFVEQGLISGTAKVTRISGTASRVDGGRANEFRVWIEDGVPRPLPLRIEYQPRIFLRLTFEAVV